MLIHICTLVIAVSFAGVTSTDLYHGQASSVYRASGQQNVTVCPDDYSPRDDCVTLDQLLSANLIKSNTTFKFVSATFEMKRDSVIRFEYVSNIVLESAGPHKATISCGGNNGGFIFHDVTRAAVHNMQFSNCKSDYYCAFQVTESSDILFHNLEFKDVQSCGVRAYNNFEGFTISNTLFSGMNYVGLFYVSSRDRNKNAVITIANSIFEGSRCEIDALACAMYIKVSYSKVNYSLINTTITNNTRAMSVPSILVYSYSEFPSYFINGLYSSNNFVVGNPLDRYNNGYKLTFQIRKAVTANITIINSHFLNTTFTRLGSGLDVEPYLPHGGVITTVLSSSSSSVTIRIKNSTISDNSGWYKSIVRVTTSQYGIMEHAVQINNLTVSNNRFLSNLYCKRGVLYFSGISKVGISNISIQNNSATGLLAVNSMLYLGGFTVLQGNQGYNGGGMALYGDCLISMSVAATLICGDNVAKNKGGGVYAELDSLYDYNPYPCLIIAKVYSESIEFFNNSAKTAGNDWYGGNYYMCSQTDVLSDSDFDGWQTLENMIYSSVDRYDIEITSDPLHVCDCTRSNEDCINVVRTIQQVQTYPGKVFYLSLIAVGTVLNTTTLSGVPSAIYADLLQLNPNTGNVSSTSLVHTGERNCSDLPYRVNSTDTHVVMVLSVENNINMVRDYYLKLWQSNLSYWHEVVFGLFRSKLAVPAYVEIELLPCPVGFASPAGKCTCHEALRDYAINCSIDTMLITRRPHIWLSHVQSTNSSSEYMTHRHCPFDYCKPGEVDFSLENPDTQCSGHRSGILCGKCKPGYSLTLGKSECRQCTNLYLLLLIQFLLAGVLLIVFLSLTEMTVTAGTINGLLFFANIVQENHTAFFPPQAAGSFLSVFIAWLNLDFGITSCFYNGLDSYAFTWLQFAFPMFIWILAFSIIVASRYVNFMNKLCGGNIVPVLATLFLLSYTKLQRLITTSLSFTVVDVSDGSKYFVWLEDGNVRYLQGKHIPLFLVSILFLVVLFIPYTLSVMLGPWLQTKTRYRVFCWVLKLKPFFDACFGPLKDKHRYWTGVLLVSRVILSLISAVNVLGDDSVNLVAITILVIILMALLWQSGGVYKLWIFSLLDSAFLANLGILGLITVYNKESGGSQYATVYTSTGSAFAFFCVTLFYHCLKRLKTRFKPRNPEVFLQRDSAGSDDDDDDASDDELFNAIDRGRESINPFDQEMYLAVENLQELNVDTY